MSSFVFVFVVGAIHCSKKPLFSGSEDRVAVSELLGLLSIFLLSLTVFFVVVIIVCGVVRML